ncbi:UNVERIFIED_CONTAM: hypothetical protein Slati_0404100 [Sesamum latifolium]|uniref:Uncharacterized protein n=1 Tax=Sesamum latifolium TaxID=2727402 RepID=A0AAW2XX88_9LAMI
MGNGREIDGRVARGGRGRGRGSWAGRWGWGGGGIWAVGRGRDLAAGLGAGKRGGGEGDWARGGGGSGGGLGLGRMTGWGGMGSGWHEEDVWRGRLLAIGDGSIDGWRKKKNVVYNMHRQRV